MGFFGSRSPYKQRMDAYPDQVATLQDAPILGGMVQRAPMAAPVHPAYNDPGGLRGKLSSFADDLLAFSGNPLGMAGVQARNSREQALQAEDVYQRHYGQQRQDAVADDERNFGQSLQLANWKAQHPDVPSAQRLIEWAAALPEGDPRRAMAQRALPGAAYDVGLQQPLIDARTSAAGSLAAARAGLSLRNKQAPTYAQTHTKPNGGGAAPKPPSGFILD